MVYSGLYRCSGCSVAFSDPAAWRNGADAPTVDAATSSQAAMVPPSHQPSSGGYSTWGTMAPRAGDPNSFGYRPEDIKAIQDAADWANKNRTRT